MLNHSKAAPRSEDTPAHPSLTSKIVMIEVLSATMFAHRYLFEDAVVSEGEGKEILESSKIYFLCSTKRLRFDLARTTVDPTGILKCYLILGTEKQPRIEVQMLPFLLAFEDAKTVRSAAWQISKFALNFADSTPTELVCEAITVDGDVVPFLIPVSGLFWMPSQSLGAVFNILYVGQSFSQLKRLRRHEKLNEATSQLPDDEELCALSFEFNVGVLGAEIGSELWNLFTMSFERDSDQHRRLVNIIERSLIKFIQPPLNKNLSETRLATDDDVARLLIANGARYIMMGIGMEGENWTFTRGEVMLPELVHYDLQSETNGFVEGMPHLG